MKFDIIIVGAGPGGYVAAIRAAQLGMKTAIVEREHLGGICLNWGCIPTKALLRSAEVFELMRNAKDYGLAADNVRIDADAIVQRSRAVSGRLSQGVSGLLKKNKVQTIWGEARLTAPGRLSVAEPVVRSSRPRPDKPTGALGAGEYTADHIVIATGARPRILPGLEPDGERIWTYFEAMTPKRMPERLLVIGSGAIGVEFASFYSGLGSKVTMVEALPQILPAEDEEIARFARAQFEKQGIAIRTGVTVKSANRAPDGRMVATVEGEGASEEIVADAIIVAVGVQGNVENLGLEALGVKLDRGCIAADGYGRTNVPGLYAIGDVAGPPMLAHKAEHEGVVCVEAILGMPTHPDPQGDHPRLHLQPAADRQRRPHRGQGEGGRVRAARRALSLRRERQGDRARGRPWARQDDLRRDDRKAPRRAYGRRRGHRTHPGLHDRDEPRDDRG